MAFQCAKQERRSFIDAYRGDTSEKAVREALKDIAALERLQTALFGTTRSERDRRIEEMERTGTEINVLNLRGFRERPESAIDSGDETVAQNPKT